MSPQPDIMTLLQDARPEHLDPAPDPRRRQHDLARALGEAAQLPPARRRVIRPSRVVYGLTAAAAVAAIAVATASGPTAPGSTAGPAAGAQAGTPAGSATGSGSTSSGEPSSLNAAQILLVAADQVRTAPASGRYWRTTTDLYSLELAGPAKNPYVIRSGDREQNWVARSESGTSWGAYKGLGREPASAADRVAWQRDGSPKTFAVHGNWVDDAAKGGKKSVADLPGAPTAWTVNPYNAESKVFFIGHELSMSAVRDLPADPQALRAFLLTDYQRNVKAGSPTQDEWIFDTATDLLTLPVSPDVRAAAYRIMSGLSGVQSLGRVSDLTGRAGNAVAVQGTDGQGRFEKRIIIDAASGLLLADETRYLEPGPKLSWLKPTDVWQTTVVTDIGWTDDKPPARTRYTPSGNGVG
jgi:hypothetical protein